MKIGKYLTLNQLTHSDTAVKLGIENTPTAEQLKNITDAVLNIYDKLADEFGPENIRINSCFRSKELNTKIPGSSFTSQHCANNGAAFDFDGLNKVTNKMIFDYCKENLLFDQLIWEFGNDSNPDWVHVSYNKARTRKQILKTIHNNKGKTEYIKL